jgi:hypothetical protein
VAPGDDEERTVVERHVVEHHADREDVVVGVRIERPVLVPLDRGAVSRRLHVELRALEAEIRTDQRGQHVDHLRLTDDRVERRMHLVRLLDAAHLRLARGVAGLEIVDRRVRIDGGGPRHELADDPAQRDELSRIQEVGNDDEAVALVGGLLIGGDHPPRWYPV